MLKFYLIQDIYTRIKYYSPDKFGKMHTGAAFLI